MGIRVRKTNWIKRALELLFMAVAGALFGPIRDKEVVDVLQG